MNGQNYDTYGDVMSVTEVAILLGSSRQYVYKLIRQKKLFAIPLGKGFRIPKTAVIAMVEGRKIDDV